MNAESLAALIQSRSSGTSAAVLDAFRVVPRHLFLPGVPPEEAYRDDAIVTKRDEDGQPISSSSQPGMMAIMLDQLGISPGQRVLEIGAGTGYNAAVMSQLGASVVTMDIDDDLVRTARSNLARAGFPDVTVQCGDGAAGFAPGAPYDRIIATVGVWELSPEWIAQLAPGGRIVVPLDLGGVQRSVAFSWDGTRWASSSVVPCWFMTLRGPSAGPLRTVQVGDVSVSGGLSGDLSALDGTPVEVPMDVNVPPARIFMDLGLWVGVRDPRWCVLTSTRALLPSMLLTIQDQQITVGLLAPDGLALIGDKTIYGYGVEGADLAAALAGYLSSWDPSRELHVSAYPAGTPAAGEVVLDKTHYRYGLDWS